MTTFRSTSPMREQRPFAWLRPMPIVESLPNDAIDGLRVLRDAVQGQEMRIARTFVEFTLVNRNDRIRQAAPLSVINRRRRSARLWFNAVLDGRIDRGTLHALVHSWMPQLAGTGPDLSKAARIARTYIEYLRGAITAAIFDRPREVLVPEAKAVHALDTVLAVHLEAVCRMESEAPERVEKIDQPVLRSPVTHL